MELPNRAKLEEKLGKRLQLLSERHKKELLTLLGTPPDFTRVTESFWKRVEREAEEEVAALLLLLFTQSASTHIDAASRSSVAADIDGGLSSFRDLQPIVEQRAETFGRQRGKELGQRHAGNARQRLENLESRVNEMPDELSRAETVKESGPVFSPATTISHTRDYTTTARHEGAEEGVRLVVGVSDNDLWKNRPLESTTGPCELCEPLNDTPRSVWSIVYPEGPPQPHVGCVCVIEYAFERGE